MNFSEKMNKQNANYLRCLAKREDGTRCPGIMILQRKAGTL